MIRVNIVVTHECQEVFGCHLGVSWCLFPSAKGPCPPNIYLRKKCASWVWEPTWSNDVLREAKFSNIWLHAAITFIKKKTKKECTKWTPSLRVQDPVYLLSVHFSQSWLNLRVDYYFYFFVARKKKTLIFVLLNTLKSPSWKQMGKRWCLLKIRHEQ